MTVLDCNRQLAQPVAKTGGRYWRVRILGSLLQATPLHAVACVLLYICSQASLLAAVLLPWKLLVALSTDTVSGLMPAFLRGFPADDRVLILSAGVVIAFLLYGLCESCISAVCNHGVRSILLRHQKTGLFGSHRQQAAALYRRLMRAAGATVSCAFIGLWLFFFYPLLLAALATYLCAGLLIAHWWKSAPPKARTVFQSPELRSNAWWSLGFLYAVGWVVADHARGSLPDATITFVSLLLARQAIVLSAQIYRAHDLLEQQRNKAGALFLADVPWQPTLRQDNAFQALLEQSCLRSWVGDALNTHFCQFDEEFALQCRMGDSGKAISVTAIGQRQSVLLKLYHTSREELAHHEMEILQIADDSWPIPSFIARHMVDGHTCLILDWGTKAHWMAVQERASWLPHLREQLLQCDLPETLVSRYDRSHPHLADRLKVIDLGFLETLVPRSLNEAFGKLREHWPALHELTRAMPRQIVIPRLHQHRIGSVDGKPVICNWSRWRWEPVGAGWPRNSTNEQLQKALASAGTTRPTLSVVVPAQARLAGLLYEFDYLIRQRDFASAMKLIVPIFDLIGHDPAGCQDDNSKSAGGNLAY